jgi:hypothetical protein
MKVILLGALFILFGALNIRRGSSNLYFIGGVFYTWDRDEHPYMFWAGVFIKFAIGIFAIVYGCIHLR